MIYDNLMIEIRTEKELEVSFFKVVSIRNDFSRN